ncbi:MAG: GLPGLI family protein, partial [Flavobacteriales bacterium]|nr:GLPGLI family protein [Flavobacteriales bacterium]
MKYILSLLIITTSILGTQAQTTSGKIIYTEVINTKPDMKKAEEQGWAQWADMVPESMTFKKQLVFNQSASMYVNVKVEEDDNEKNMMKRMMRRYSNANNQTFINADSNVFVEQQDFMGKTFLIKGEPKKITWKITGEMKIIMSYPCLKATYTDSTETLEAWFTTEIPVSIGPEKYGQLPGMILELTSKKDKKTLTATEMEFKEIPTEELTEPTEGKVVTREEYNEIVKKKMKE